MEHPDPKCRQKQAKFLAQCSPEDRAYHGALFRVGNAVYCYHQIAMNTTSVALMQGDYPEWLEGLPPNIRKEMKRKGFEE